MIVFNSLYNKTSFLNHINTFLKMSPDKLRVDIKRDLEPKCSVLYFPLNLDETLVASIIAEAVLCESLIYFNYEAYLSIIFTVNIGFYLEIYCFVFFF